MTKTTKCTYQNVVAGDGTKWRKAGRGIVTSRGWYIVTALHGSAYELHVGDWESGKNWHATYRSQADAMHAAKVLRDRHEEG